MADDGLSEKSFGDLVQQASRQTAELVRQELRLAQAELREKGRRAGLGAGLLGGAGVIALYGAGALVAAVIMLVAVVIEPWVAALIVGVVLLAVAGVMALSGKRQAQQVPPPLPEHAVESVQEDVRRIKERTGR